VSGSSTPIDREAELSAVSPVAIAGDSRSMVATANAHSTTLRMNYGFENSIPVFLFQYSRRLE
jgi:hypothetical protein